MPFAGLGPRFIFHLNVLAVGDLILFPFLNELANTGVYSIAIAIAIAISVYVNPKCQWHIRICYALES
jgi:hypothetical protein